MNYDEKNQKNQKIKIKSIIKIYNSKNCNRINNKHQISKFHIKNQ